MKHYDEITIELYVLSSSKVENEKEQIKNHLEECFSCNELHSKIKSFYDSVEGSQPAAVSNETFKEDSVAIKPVIVADKNLSEVSPVPKTFTEITWFYFRNNPVKSSISTIAAALVLFALFNFKSLLPKDEVPARLIYNDDKMLIEVFNSSNETLWEIPYLFKNNGFENYLNLKESDLKDINNDGKIELISVVQLLGSGNSNSNQLNIFSDKGQLIFKKELGQNCSFQKINYLNDFNSRGLIINDFDNDGNDEIFVGLYNRRSPYILVRLDNNGNILGEYWHYGHIWGFHKISMNNDYKFQIVLCGHDELTNQAKIIVLDPLKIIGKQESSTTRGFGFEKSNAEIISILIPATDLEKQSNIKPRVLKLLETQENNSFQFLLGDFSNGVPEFDILFNNRFQFKEIKPTDNATRMRTELVQKGKLDAMPNPDYQNLFKNEIKYWDGKEWIKK